MPLSGNKGEWSEIYTLFKLLADGRLYAGDANLNRTDIYYPVIDIIRQEAKRYDYLPDSGRQIVVINEEGDVLMCKPMADFAREADRLLGHIKQHSDSAFSLPDTEKFMRAVGCSSIKARSRDKADIHIILHDHRTGFTPQQGFSIKSQLGEPSTLLNASNATNFLFEIQGAPLSDLQMAEINRINSQQARMRRLFESGHTIVFREVEHPVFRNNLLFIDCGLPALLGACLVQKWRGSHPSKLTDVAAQVAGENPLAYQGDNVLTFYEHKLKIFLLDIALGMMPAHQWNGCYEANGGYIVVKEDGDIVCYHFYDRNEIESYLFVNTHLDTPSRSRHRWGSLFRHPVDGAPCLRLNLQIRFIR